METFDASLSTAPAEGGLSPALLLVPPGLPLGEGPFPGWGSFDRGGWSPEALGVPLPPPPELRCSPEVFLVAEPS